MVGPAAVKKGKLADKLVKQAAGVNVVQLSRALGHHSASFTLDTYTHEWEHGEAAKKATNVMEQTFAALV